MTDSDQQGALRAQNLLRSDPVLSSCQVFSASQSQRLAQNFLSGNSGQISRRPQRRGVVLPGDDFGCVKTAAGTEVTEYKRGRRENINPEFTI